MDVYTARLRLWPMTEAFLLASLARDTAEAESQLGASISPEWFDERPLMEVRLADLRVDPEARPWLLRAIVDKATRQMVGHIGFHSRPDSEHVRKTQPGAVEFGYTTFAPYRRRGIAREALLGLLRWARDEQHVAHFVASASPENTPSISLLRQLGFERVGGQMDEVDGYEDVYLIGAERVAERSTTFAAYRSARR